MARLVFNATHTFAATYRDGGKGNVKEAWNVKWETEEEAGRKEPESCLIRRRISLL